MAKKNRKIYVTLQDLHKLKLLLQAITSPAYQLTGLQGQYLESLCQEIDRSQVVDEQDLPDGVVTMNSTIKYRDLDTAEEDIVTLVMPEESDYSARRISILAPIGTALFGYRKGDALTWEVPAGKRRIEIVEVFPPAPDKE